MDVLESYLRPKHGELPGPKNLLPAVKERDRPEFEDQLSSGSAPVTIPQAQPFSQITKEKSQVTNSEVAFVVDLQITASQASYDWGKTIIVEWKHSGIATSSDWIGIYKKDDPYTTYYNWAWVTVGDGKKGSLAFVAPNVSGEYEFRYFNMKSYNLFGRSKCFKVGPQFEIVGEVVTKNAVKIFTKEFSSSPVSFNTYIAMYSQEDKLHKDYYTFSWTKNNEPTL